jgi:hypothetical protein
VEAFHVAETMCIDYDGEEGYLGDIIPDGQQPPFPFDGRRPK